MPSKYQKFIFALPLTLSCILCAFVAEANTLALNTPSPEMIFKVCPDLDSARVQNTASKKLATVRATPIEYENALNKKDECELVQGKLILREEAPIKEFLGWAPEIRPGGEYEVRVLVNGRPHELRLGLTLQTLKYYKADYQDPDGKQFKVWVELPVSPPIVRYVEEKKRTQVSSLGVPDGSVGNFKSGASAQPASYSPNAAKPGG